MLRFMFPVGAGPRPGRRKMPPRGARADGLRPQAPGPALLQFCYGIPIRGGGAANPEGQSVDGPVARSGPPGVPRTAPPRPAAPPRPGMPRGAAPGPADPHRKEGSSGVRSGAGTVGEYLDGLGPERRRAVSEIRGAILGALPDGYAEAMEFGMIAYVVPLERYPDTYNGRPLMYAAVSSERRYVSVHLMGLYADPDARRSFEEAYRASGRRLDMGAACLRLRSLDDLPLDLIAGAVAAAAPEEWIRIYERSRAAAGRRRPARRGPAGGPAGSGP